jgi:hypothetical protein
VIDLKTGSDKMGEKNKDEPGCAKEEKFYIFGRDFIDKAK